MIDSLKNKIALYNIHPTAEIIKKYFETYDKDGYDKDGYDKDGYDKDGYDEAGYNKYGYDKDGECKYCVRFKCRCSL